MKPLALLTNDDGYNSPGLEALWQTLDADFETFVVAPTRQRSWIGKALTNPGPLTIDEKTIEGKTVFVVNDGLPADCVNIGLYHLCPRRPTMVLAGINIGANFTRSLALASGTFGAALEAAQNGVLGIAVSVDFDAETYQMLEGGGAGAVLEHFETAAQATREFIARVLPEICSAGVKLINLVLPQHPAEPFYFFRADPLAYDYGSVFVKRGSEFYNRSAGFLPDLAKVVPESDVWAVSQGYVAYTCYSGSLQVM